jgi:hypothetical protein
MSETQPEIADYKRRIEVEEQSIVIDEQVPINERTDVESINAGSLVEFGAEHWFYGDEFPDSVMYNDGAFFHTEYGRGFLSRNGEWNENTALTDFFRGIAGSDVVWHDIRGDFDG